MNAVPEPGAPSVDHVRAWLRSAVAAAAEVEEAAVDPGRPFHEYGVTSAQAVSLSGELEELLDRSLPPTLLYEHPTIDALATALVAEPGSDGPLRVDAATDHLRASAAQSQKSGIAVVGVACRFPGDADDPERFWANLLSGHDAARQVPADRWSLEGFLDPDPAAPGRSYTDRGGFLGDLAGFDAQFFGIPPAEAGRMEPQHRLLLEVVWAALEDAGVAAERVRGSRTGVFVGQMTSQEWSTLQTEREGDSCLDDPFFGFGLAPSVAAGRLSYVLDARGPSMCVDTACSSSLLALHLAARSLREGECDLAVVAGVSALVHPAAMVQACRAHMLAADGRCKTFDADADGFLIGEGCGAVVLQRVADADLDARRIRALVRGSAVTQDGRSNGMTAPNRSAQVAVIRAAHADARIDASDVGFVECHGSGTRLGDAIEMAALQDVFGPARDPGRPLVVGAVKTNVGHLLGAAGLAGFIKAVLAVEHGTIPKNLHLSRPSADIDWSRGPVKLPQDTEPWPMPGRRVAGVSSFGWSGTNVHVVLEQSGELPDPGPADPGWQLVPLTAASTPALREVAARLHDHLVAHPETSVGDIAHTHQVGRTQLDHRLPVVARDRDGLLGALGAVRAASPEELGSTPPRSASARTARAVFLFPGTGDQEVGMGQALYADQPAFRSAFDLCADAAAPLIGVDLRNVVVAGDPVGTSPPEPPGLAGVLGRAPSRATAKGPFERIDVVHAAVFAVEYAMAALWRSWGVVPQRLVGYSLGEYAAAAVAEVFGVADAVRLVTRRAVLIDTLAPGAMLAVPASPEGIGPLPDGVVVSATCGTAMTVLGGPVAAVEACEASLRRAGIVSQRVASRHAMHTPQLRAVAEDLVELVSSLPRRGPRIPVVSTVTGEVLTDEQACDPRYWADQMCRPVRFDAALATVTADGDTVLLELGPGQALSTVANQISTGPGRGSVVAVPTMPSSAVLGVSGGNRDSGDEVATTLGALGRFWSEGGKVDWTSLATTGSGELVRLPTYPFQHQRFWPEGTPRAQGNRFDLADWCYESTWRRRPGPPAARGAGAGQRWLVLSHGSALARKVAEELSDRGAWVTAATPGEAVTLLSAATSFPDHVLYAPDVPEDTDHPHGGGAGETAVAVLVTALELVAALGRTSAGRRVVLTVLTDGAYDVLGDEELRLGAATLHGLGASVSQEYPPVHLRSVDVAGADAATADLVAAEVCAESDDELVAFRRGRRWVHRWDAGPVPAAPASRVWRPDGTYLITGGLGGLGLGLARRLTAWSREQSSEGRAGVPLRLALLGRRPLPPRDIWDHPENATGDVGRRVAAVRELEELGAEVLTLEADVADAAQVNAAVQAVRDRWGPIHGVVHAAGVPASGLIALKGRAEVERVLRPKVAGALALEQALAAEPLDFWVHFSSATVALGGLGESDYVAANAFLDAHAHAARRRGIPVTAVDWGPWRWDNWTSGERHAGSAEAAASSRRSLRERFGITDAQGFELLTRIVASGTPQVLVAQQELGTLAARWSELGRGVAAETRPVRTHPRPLLRTPYLEARTELERTVTGIWGRHLGVDRVGVDDAFFELGGTSLVGLTIVAELERELGITLNASDLFEAPTPGTLAALIADRRNGGAVQPPSSSAPEGSERGDRRRQRAQRAAEARRSRR